MTHRIGHGYDLHRLQPGGKLILGNVEVSAEFSPIAHSDGDVVIHALVDAILGALGEGDIGEHYPNTDSRWKNANSEVFLKDTLVKMTAAGFVVGNADVTILAERPKLKAFKPAIKKTLQDLLQCPHVNVKAGTNEGVDAIGEGRAIACHAIVLLVNNA